MPASCESASSSGRSKLNCEDVEVARPSENIDKPRQFARYPAAIPGRKRFLEGGDCRANSPHGNAHLMNALRLHGKRRGLVVQQMREAGPAYLLQRCLDAHRRIEDDGLGVGDRRCGCASSPSR